jgi:hypothetical protein
LDLRSDQSGRGFGYGYSLSLMSLIKLVDHGPSYAMYARYQNLSVNMTIELNHTIIWYRDQRGSSSFLAEILGLPAPQQFGPFHVVQLDNGVSLDFHETDREISSQHYAFLISEMDFDAVFGRICERNLDYWADPARRRPGEINRNDGGRGLYFTDPDGNFLEVITRPYGG